ncbi:hypothetical protein JCM10207_004943 [Rhodosporidiobolus poonsookiae]
MSSYGTRRASATSQLGMSPPAPAPIPLPVSSSYTASAAFSPTLSSSVGKSKRPTGITKARRMSSSQTTRPSSGIAGISSSVPVGSAALARGRSSSISQTLEGTAEDDAILASTSVKSRKDKGQTFECEKCSKVYRHSTCLTKHRWHWREASKLLLSKHQQVQLLEGAAILAAASAGTSLPDEKHFWPAAVSPPASGLLGSSELGINMHALSASGPGGFGSPRFAPSSLLSDAGDFDARSEVTIDEDSDEDDSPSPGRNGSPDADDQIMEDGMFDLDLGGSGELPPASPLPPANVRLPTLNDRRASPATSDDSLPPAGRPGIVRAHDSAYGSLGRSGTLKAPSAPAAAAGVRAPNPYHSPNNRYHIPLGPPPPQQQPARPVVGFFVPASQ